MKQKIIFCILVIVLLASCAKATHPVPIALSATETASYTVAATLTKAPTSTMAPEPSFTSTTKSTAAVVPDPKIIQKCLQVNNNVTAMQDIATGTIVFHPIDEKYMFAQDLSTGKKYKLPTETFEYAYGNLAVSPDGNKLAYDERTLEKDSYYVVKDILWIVNAHSDVLQKVTFDYGLWRTRWLDNERLLFYIWETDKNGRVLTVNPFKHEQHYVWNKLPGFYQGGVFWWTTWLAEYSPNLEWVVYFGQGSMDYKTIVYDITKRQDIWRSANGDYADSAWSLNGDEVAITTYKSVKTEKEGNGNLYIINRKGLIKPAFEDDRPNTPTKPSWSPDGRYIAFWNDHTVMLYDKQTDQIFDYCIDDGWDTHHPPLWSPNSQQFIIQGGINQGSATSVLIDIQKNIAYTLSKTDYYPEQWMNSLP